MINMAKILYLDYISFLLYAMMLVAYHLRSTKGSGRRRLFAVLLTVGLFATLYDICAVWLDNSGPGAVSLKYILHIGYLILRNLTTPLCGIYIIAVSDTFHKFKNLKLTTVVMWLPFAVASLLTLSSPVTHLVFYINANDEYTRGPLFFVLYLSAAFYVLFCIFHSIKYYNIIGVEKFVPLILIVPSQIVAIAIQFVFPKILCEMISTALCFLVILLIIERPEAKIDRGTGLLSLSAFSSTIRQSCSSSKPLSVVFIQVTNYPALSSYLSFSNIEQLFINIGSRLEEVKKSLGVAPGIYILNNGLFAVILTGKDIPFATRFANHVVEALAPDFSVSKFSVSVLANAFVLKLPEDTEDFETIRLLVSNIRNSKYSSEVTMASSILANKDYKIMINMDTILKEAIKNDEFEVYFQPIYSVKEGRFNSAEALIRLFSKEYGFIRPDLFIPISENSGAIHKIGLIVFEKVCQFIASKEYKALGLDYIEVNLSTVQCSDSSLSNKIMQIMDKYGVKPAQINLEITETASNFMQKNMMNNIYELDRKGFSFSLDDFGTGYSNMVRIASLPLHIVKLDRSFTSLQNNEDLKHILADTIQLVKKMDMKIVAEGIETEEMLNIFEEYGCDFIQGYYFSKPLPRNDFIDFIAGYELENSYVK